MKRVLLVFMLLAACSKAPTQGESTPAGFDDLAKNLHMTPAELRTHLAAAKQHEAEEANDPRDQERLREVQRQEADETNMAQEAKCAYRPYADGCTK